MPFGILIAIGDGVVNGETRDVSASDMETDVYDVYTRSTITELEKIEIAGKVAVYCVSKGFRFSLHGDPEEAKRWYSVVPNVLARIRSERKLSGPFIQL